MKFSLKLILYFILLLIIFTGCGEKIQENKTIIPKETKEIISYQELPQYSYYEQQLNFDNNGKQINGLLFIPDSPIPKKPTIILSHGLGESFESELEYGRQLASKGIVTYCFNFYGGGINNPGNTTEMSVLTEASDLKTVLDGIRSIDLVDNTKIALFGESQGGLVSAIVASENKDLVNGLILLYPAFNIPDVIHAYFNNIDDIPSEYNFGWITLGKVYANDLWNFELDQTLEKYDKKVLIIHGTEDDLVSLDYSQRAKEKYIEAELFTIEGAGHGFENEEFDDSLVFIFNYLQKIDFLSN